MATAPEELSPIDLGRVHDRGTEGSQAEQPVPQIGWFPIGGGVESSGSVSVVERLPPLGLDLSNFAPAQAASVLGVGDATRLRAKFHIPANVELLIPAVESRAHLPPVGWISVFEDQLVAGFRFPPHPFFINFLNHYRMSLAQIAPNGIRILVRFLLTCLEHRVNPSVELFRCFFQLRQGIQAIGFAFFQSRSSFQIKTPENNRRWKTKFFFVKNRGIGLVEEWNYETRPDTFRKRDRRQVEGRSILENIPNPDGLVVTEEELVKYHLSPAPPEQLRVPRLSSSKGGLALSSTL